MSELYLFYENRILKGIFNDKKELKIALVHHIIDFHVEKKIYDNKVEAGKKLKSKLVNFFKEKYFFLENKNNIWSIIKLDANKILDIKIQTYKTCHTELKIKGHRCNKKDLYHDLAYLNLEELYDKS